LIVSRREKGNNRPRERGAIPFCSYELQDTSYKLLRYVYEQLCRMALVVRSL